MSGHYPPYRRPSHPGERPRIVSYPWPCASCATWIPEYTAMWWRLGWVCGRCAT